MTTDHRSSKRPRGLSRRRMIAITAAGAASAMPALAWARREPTAPNQIISVWRGLALGAEAQIQLVHDDPTLAAGLLTRCRQEIARLEGLFSLYRPDSALSRLNRDGALAGPAQEMVELMSLALAVGRDTNGAFDITVQPLWKLYADHFAAPGADPEGPDEQALATALGLVDYRQVGVSSRHVAFARAGMAATLNGIAQGYITDRVAALLRRNGFTNVLVHLGETYGMGEKTGGKPWVAGIAGITARIPLKDMALATSGGYGSTFSADGQHHHLFDPRTGRSTNRYASVSVIDPSAAVSDGLSTAFAAMPLEQVRRIVSRRPATKALVAGHDGEIIEV